MPAEIEHKSIYIQELKRKNRRKKKTNDEQLRSKLKKELMSNSASLFIEADG